MWQEEIEGLRSKIGPEKMYETKPEKNKLIKSKSAGVWLKW
jgi:hypothetical protein